MKISVLILSLLLFGCVSTPNTKDFNQSMNKETSFTELSRLSCNELDTSLKNKTLRLKQLMSEKSESSYRNAGTGLASLSLFAPAVLELDVESDGQSNEFSGLQKQVVYIHELADKKECENVRSRLVRFEKYLDQLNDS
jgi:hypothetical protein